MAKKSSHRLGAAGLLLACLAVGGQRQPKPRRPKRRHVIRRVP
jgi:hypothetical protein